MLWYREGNEACLKPPLANMWHRDLKAGQPQPTLFRAATRGEEVLGAFPLNFDFQGQPHPQVLWGEAAGGPAGRDTSGFLFPAGRPAEG